MASFLDLKKRIANPIAVIIPAVIPNALGEILAVTFLAKDGIVSGKKELFEKLQQNGVIVRPGFYFGMPTYQRVSLGTKDQMTKFFDLVEQFLKEENKL